MGIEASAFTRFVTTLLCFALFYIQMYEVRSVPHLGNRSTSLSTQSHPVCFLQVSHSAFHTNSDAPRQMGGGKRCTNWQYTLWSHTNFFTSAKLGGRGPQTGWAMDPMDLKSAP